MKKSEVVLLVLLFVIAMLFNSFCVGRYTRNGIVKGVNSGSVLIVDDKGKTWEYIDKKGELHKGDEVTVKIYDNGTEKYYSDDVVESVKRK